jgi:hypothetical protein
MGFVCSSKQADFVNIFDARVRCMNNNDLKRLSRRELVDVIYQMKKNEEQLRAEIAALQDELRQKRINISEAGTIASAAADITQLFAVAQRAADIYLQEIADMRADTERECAKIIENAKNRAEMRNANPRVADTEYWDDEYLRTKLERGK